MPEATPVRVSVLRVVAVIGVLVGGYIANRPLEHRQLRPATLRSLQPMSDAYVADSGKSTYTAPSSYSVGPTQGPTGG